MSNIAIEFENISKQYRLGTIGTGTISHDLNRWWHLVRGKEDPYLTVGEVNDRSTKATSDYVWALRDITFNVEQGEVLGIIGKNGAGKSTLLKILSRITSPSTGTIKAKGRIASLLEVGTGFHGEMTGRENIYMNGAIMGMTRHEITRKLDEIIEFSGVEKYIDTPVKRYSSGMTVRLGFAVAAHLEPEILVVDEVLAVGDAEFQKKAIGKMKDVSLGKGRTVLFVSHNMASVQLLCNKAIILENGQVLYDGMVSNAIEHYYSQCSNNSTDIFDRVDRRGNQKLTINQIEAYTIDSNSNLKIQPQTGKDIYFRFVFNKKFNFNDDLFRFDFRIEDGSGVRVAWLSTKLIETNNDRIGDSIIFSILQCPFNAGKYYITFACYMNNDLVDWVQNAYSFDVYEGLFYTTGFQVPKEQSAIYHNFNIEFK